MGNRTWCRLYIGNTITPITFVSGASPKLPVRVLVREVQRSGYGAGLHQRRGYERRRRRRRRRLMLQPARLLPPRHITRAQSLLLTLPRCHQKGESTVVRCDFEICEIFEHLCEICTTNCTWIVSCERRKVRCGYVSFSFYRDSTEL